MNKKLVIIEIAVVLLSIIVFYYLNKILPTPEEDYQRVVKQINEYKDVCESAGFIFEQEGELKNPSEWIVGFNPISLKCYEIRNNVKVYYNLGEMEKIK